MGGRGTYAAGYHAEFRYRTVGSVGGVKILKPIDPKASGKITRRIALCQGLHTARPGRPFLPVQGIRRAPQSDL